MELRGESIKVIVTGATGFVGGRLVEVLAGKRGVRVTALVRDFSKVARIARLGVPLMRADLLDPDSWRAALAGADVVFHCGYGGHLDARVERERNLGGTINLAHEAAKQQVRRFVHLSSMAVYGHDLPTVVTEKTPPRPTTSYGQIKLEIEQRLREISGSSGLDVRMVRPTKVYGPYDYNFTVPTIQKLLDGKLWLIERGSGIVSPNYVDNLVQGLLRCAEQEGINGGVYIMADGMDLTWAEFFRFFSRIAGSEPCGNVTRAECEAAAAAARRPPSLRMLFQTTVLSKEARGLYPKYPWLRALHAVVPQAAVKMFKKQAPRAASFRELPSAVPPRPPSLNEYRDYTRSGSFSIELAKEELGYRPHVSIEEAIDRTAAWLRFADVIPSPIAVTAALQSHT